MRPSALMRRARSLHLHGKSCGRRTSSREWVTVPADSPRGTQACTLPGAAPKFLARFIDGRYVVGLTPEEVEVRHRGCVDLVEQLQKTVLQFAVQNPVWTKAQLCERLRRGIAHEQHRWELSSNEAESGSNGLISGELPVPAAERELEALA